MNVATIEIGTAIAAMNVLRKIPHEQEDNDRSQDAADDQVFVDGIDRSFDEPRLVANHIGVNIRRKLGANFLQAAL